jgi:hypothetical protein
MGYILVYYVVSLLVGLVVVSGLISLLHMIVDGILNKTKE